MRASRCLHTKFSKMTELSNLPRTSMLQKGRTNSNAMFFAVFLFFISSFPLTALAQNCNTSVSCPTGAKCFTSEPQTITHTWGYNGHICSNMIQCYGESAPGYVGGPRQKPGIILEGDTLLFAPWTEAVSFKFKPFNVSKANFDSCVVEGESLIPSFTSQPFEVPQRFINTTGIKYFSAQTDSNLFTCHFGMKLEVYVRSRTPCINPTDTTKGVCSGKGTCAMTGHFFNINMTCVCCQGYTGKYCQELDSCLRGPCQNGGSCADIHAGHLDSYNCTCVPGYTGMNCEKDINECASDPCQNGGFCVNGINSYKCACQPDTNGDNCETVVPNLCEPFNPCKNGGTCTRILGNDGNRSNYSCTCLAAFTGRNCTINITSSALPAPSTVQGVETSTFTFTSVPQTSGVYQTSVSTALPTPSYVVSSIVTTAVVPSPSATAPVQYSTSTPELSTSTPSSTAPSSHPVETNSFMATTAMASPSTGFTTSSIIQPSSSKDKETLTSSANATIVETSAVIQSSSASATMATGTVSMETVTGSSVSMETVIGSSVTMATVNSSSATVTMETATGSSVTIETITGSSASVTMATVTWTSMDVTSSQSSSEIQSSTKKTAVINPSTALQPSSTGQAFTTTQEHSSVTPLNSAVETMVMSSSAVASPSEIAPSSTQASMIPTSSAVPTPTPTVPVQEMTCSNTPCGTGKCTDTKDHLGLTNFTCQCPYPTFGPRCNKDYIPHFMRFGVNSYLVHKEISLSLASNKIVIAFKTNATDGLLFFSRHKRYPDFFQLHITEGKLEFRFDPGDRLVAIKSIVNVNTGTKVTAVITYNSNTKEGSLQVDNGVVCRGKSTGKLRGINLASKWYIGGVPPSVLMNATKGTVSSPSLIGCISDIELNNDDIKFTEAISWYNLGECDVPCVNNPCGKNGTCIPDPDDPHDYSCKCPSGYQGKHCRNITACVGDPCNGGKCVIPDATKPHNHACLCSFGKAGISCQHDITITVPGFDMLYGYSSYIEYPPPTAGRQHFAISLQFKVDNNAAAWNDGLLMFSGQNQYLGKGDDFIALCLNNGSVLFQYNLGSGLARISSCALDKNQTWHSVLAGRDNREGYLYVDNCAKVRGSSEGQLSGLTVYTSLYFGGVPDLSELPIDVGCKSGFQGNMHDIAVRYNVQEQFQKLPFIQTQGLKNRVISGSNVGNESYNECISRMPPCLNGGKCTRHGATYTCQCTDGWKGLYCSSRTLPCLDHNPCVYGSTCREKQQGVVCDCPLGRTGNTCSQKVNIQAPLFKEFSYMAFKPVYIRGSTAISIKFTPKTLNGLLFYTTHLITSFTGDFLSIALHNGYVQARYDLGSGVGFAQTRQTIILNKEVTIQLMRTAQTGSLQLSNNAAVEIKSPGRAEALDVKSNFYLGGVPQLSSVNPKAVEDSLSLKDYTGCIAEVTVNGQKLVLTETGAIEGRNIDNCPSTLA